MNLINVTPYNVTSLTQAEAIITDKIVNRNYTCEIDESGTTQFHPSGFYLSPNPNYEKILWGAPEKIDGTSEGPLNDVYNTEDYDAYNGLDRVIDDNDIVLGNIQGAQTLRRKPFYVNGYYDGKSATNVIPSAEISSVGISGDSYYYFDVTNLGGNYANTEAFSIKFPDGYVANCSRREQVGNATRLFCYSFGDDYTAGIIDRSNSGDTMATNYLKRASIFPSISYTTYVAPFYREVNLMFIESSPETATTVDSICYKKVWYMYGKVNGGVTYGGNHYFSSNYSNSVSVPASGGNIHLPDSTGYTGETDVTDSLFSYNIAEGLGVNIHSIQQLSLGDSVSYSVFPVLMYDGTYMYAEAVENMRFYIGMQKCFKLNSSGVPVLDESSSAFNNRVPQDLSELGGTDITSSITTSGYSYTYDPTQQNFIVGVYTNYDPNDTGEGENRRPMTRLFKLYRNHEIKNIG